MKQHPIPHNILDIEFKLFTKFTIREFVYIMIGFTVGGMFLYLYTQGVLPGWLAIPIFLITSGFGLFLGLVPINDQKADVYLMNYISAISKPTRRVWKNEQFDEKTEEIAKTRGLTLTQGTMTRDATNSDQPGSAKIIGATQISENSTKETSETEQLDKEEIARLSQIESVVKDDPLVNAMPQQIISQSDTASGQYSPTPTTALPSTPITVNANTSISQTPIAQTPTLPTNSLPIDSALPSNVPSTSGVIPTAPADMNIQPTQISTAPTSEVAPVLPAAPVELPPTTPGAIAQNSIPSIVNQVPSIVNQITQNPAVIKISAQNAMQFKSELKELPLVKNQLRLQLTDAANNLLPEMLVIIKDQNYKPVSAKQTDLEGLFITNKELLPGTYSVEVMSEKFRFPSVNVIIDGGELPLIKLTALPA